MTKFDVIDFYFFWETKFDVIYNFNVG